MIYMNSLLFLRLINIILIILLLMEVYDQIKSEKAWKNFWKIEKIQEKTSLNELKWSEIDLEKPPKLNDSVLEALRLNELLSKPQFICKNRKTIGGPVDNFLVCFDQRFLNGSNDFKKTLVITGLTNSAGVFESELNTTRWEAFIPPDSPILDEFKTDVEVSYIPEVVEEGYFPMEAILTGIQDDYYSISKLELYSNHMDESQLEKSPNRVEKILSRLQTDQLLLQIRIENSSAIEVIPKWIQLVYSLFFKYSFGFIGSLTNGACHQPLGHCIYRASFVKTNISDIVDAPVWGLGSPGEERGRLISYFQKFGNLTNCSRISNFDENLQIPYLCYDFDDFLDCDVLYFRYRQLNQQLLDKLEDYFGTCNMQINHPEPIELIWSEGMFVEYSGLLPKNEPNQISPAKNPKNFWKLESFSTIYEKFKKKSENSQRYLIFDLDGDDLSIFDTIIDDCQIIKKFRQISFRLRIFYGEEYKNYRNLYLYFLKFENCGFSKIFSKRMSLDVFYILLKRNSGFYT